MQYRIDTGATIPRLANLIEDARLLKRVVAPSKLLLSRSLGIVVPNFLSN
jgi:hypothetical protein